MWSGSTGPTRHSCCDTRGLDRWRFCLIAMGFDQWSSSSSLFCFFFFLLPLNHLETYQKPLFKRKKNRFIVSRNNIRKAHLVKEFNNEQRTLFAKLRLQKKRGTFNDYTKKKNSKKTKKRKNQKSNHFGKLLRFFPQHSFSTLLFHLACCVVHCLAVCANFLGSPLNCSPISASKGVAPLGFSNRPCKRVTTSETFSKGDLKESNVNVFSKVVFFDRFFWFLSLLLSDWYHSFPTPIESGQMAPWFFMLTLGW